MAEQNSPKIIRPQAGFQEKFVRSNVDVAIGGGVLNCGKAQPLYSLVLTPNGWVSMGSLKVGDTICDTLGGLQKVEGVFERGLLPCKEVVFDDGSTVKCCGEHLWTVWNKTKQRYETLELNEIEHNSSSFSLDLTSPVVFNGDSDFVIHPYLLGALIGDAYMGSNKTSVKINTDREIVDRAFSLKPFDYIWHNYANRMPYALFNDSSIREELKRLGLFGKHSDEKFIPKEYLYTSIHNRVELLRGLFDTDGYNDNRSYRVEYCTVSERLASDVCFLVRSLGGKASVNTKTGSYKNEDGERVICKTAYRISCRFEDKNFFFTLSRKKRDVKKGRRICLNFKSIKDCGMEEMRCILVSNPNHLYITDDFVVTHNTFAAVLSIAEAVEDQNFRGVFLRNNLNDLKSGGGILDTFRDIYGKSVTIVESGDPSATFASGAKCDITHVADQSRDKVLQRFKGRQYDYIYFDEGTGFTWETFVTICSRNRGRAKWTGKIRMTTNPDRNHWLRTFLDWYIGIDGFIREDREGVVRYFYMAGETVKDVVWGDTKEECYHKCKIDIDRKLRKINGKTGNATYKDMIKSFTFYLGRMSENKASLGNNGGYVGTVAMSGGRNAEQLLEGNWNVSPDEDLNAVIPSDIANKVFVVDPQINNDRWITADLADSGTDNFLCLYWNGFHVEDILILGRTTPRENAERLLAFADKHDVTNSHIIYDGIRGLYINDYIPEAIPYISNMKPMGMYGRMALRLKDECYLRLVEMLKRGEMSMSDEVANRTYEHALLKERITVQNEFLEECAVVRFKDAQSGKKTLLSKKEMNQMLGRGRSMDLLDPCAMRMYPVLSLPYGDELVGTMQDFDDDDDDSNNSIYDETLWC